MLVRLIYNSIVFVILLGLAVIFHYLYDWTWEHDSRNIMKSELGNPYYAMLRISDFFVVTGDSISILSEVCSTGKPVYVYMQVFLC